LVAGACLVSLLRPSGQYLLRLLLLLLLLLCWLAGSLSNSFDLDFLSKEEGTL
jgi:hypothetical protein